MVIALTDMGKIEPAGIAARIVSIAEAKTIANEAIGVAGMVSVFVKAILCNWLVCLGVVMGMTSNSTIGKIVAIWMPIFMFLLWRSPLRGGRTGLTPVNFNLGVFVQHAIRAACGIEAHITRPRALGRDQPSTK